MNSNKIINSDSSINSAIKIKLNYFFISTILLICSYQMDLNNNYKSFLTNKIIKKYLIKYKIDEEIVTYIEKNLDLSGKVYYLTNDVNSACMCLKTSTDFYLIFIGTQFGFDDINSLIKDLYTDLVLGLNSIKNYDESIKIHEKYIENMHNNKLIDNIISLIPKHITKIVVSGHSMGSGLAVYTTMILSKKFKNIEFILVTIGSPKIGNKKLNKHLKKIVNIKHLNCINNSDIIPMFPFFSKEYYYIADETFHFFKNKKCEIKKNISLNFLTNYSINDHFCVNILNNIYTSMKYYLL